MDTVYVLLLVTINAALFGPLSWQRLAEATALWALLELGRVFWRALRSSSKKARRA